jgi:glycogen debranching enzyme
LGQLIVLDGCTFFISDETGDTSSDSTEGFFNEDVRHLSRWELLVDGKPIDVLTSKRVDYYSARIVAGTRNDKPIAVRRDRFVTDGFHEDVEVVNLSDDPQRVRVDFRFGSDFADVMEAQQDADGSNGRAEAHLGKRSITLAESRDGYRRETKITFRKEGRLRKDAMRFDLELGPRETWKTCVDVVPVIDGKSRPALLGCDSFNKAVPKMELPLEDWMNEAPTLDTDDDGLTRTYQQSIADLAALRLRPSESFEWALPAGGVPWFMTVFGRDSMIASYQALPFHPTLAAMTLDALAETQAQDFDHFADAEPGKIMHELRRGVAAATGEIPRRYYGTHDSTQLFLILLHEYWLWTGDSARVAELEEPARRALAWIEGPADQDGDGYLEYKTRSSSPTKLDNQCWKDSDGSIVFADGSLAEPPIAVCEVQGYAYDARLRTAELAEAVWRDAELAKRLRKDAEELKERFNRDFWSGRRRRYVLALDKDKRQVDSLASNIGHLLWSGIVPDDRAEGVVESLLGRELFTGWGVRCLAKSNPAYNPLTYHNGTVWPHDTSIAAEGMRRYGFRQEAADLAWALMEAATRFEYSLPEVFAGFDRDETSVPVPYPDALVPQAWAAGAPLLGLRTILGLDPVDGKLRSKAVAPREIAGKRIRLRGVRVHGKRFDAPR